MVIETKWFSLYLKSLRHSEPKGGSQLRGILEQLKSFILLPVHIISVFSDFLEATFSMELD